MNNKKIIEKYISVNMSDGFSSYFQPSYKKSMCAYK